jgi:hypothetical protein
MKVPSGWLVACAAALAAAGCSWHRPGEGDPVTAFPAAAPLPAEGMAPPEVLALAETREQGDFSVHAEALRVAKIAGGMWEDVELDRVRRPDFAPDPAADYAAVVVRSCTDWEGRERWSDERPSWFLFRRGRLAAWDHFSFGPRCGLGNSFRPVDAGSPSRRNERDLLRWLDQRYPPGPIPLELRFERGRAYVAAGRLQEAAAMLRFADDSLDAREDEMRPRAVSPEEEQAFEAESRRLHRLRADLAAEIREAEHKGR